MRKDIVFKPIGTIHSEHKNPKRTPIQPVFAWDCIGQVEVYPEYEEGLLDIEGFSHIFIIYHLHKSEPGKELTLKPFLEDVVHGVFATRYSNRPNPIGMSLVRLIRREKNRLYINDVDMLDGTPVLDIKPYNTRFEHREDVRNGWMDNIDKDTAFKRGRRDYGKKEGLNG
jgi:tRNA-Thr(GGU) m(6)t(6)A37 methyltransferase TsaA